MSSEMREIIRYEIIKALVVWGMVILLFGLMFGFARSLENPEAYMRIWGTCVECGKYMPDVTGFWEAGTCPICDECNGKWNSLTDTSLHDWEEQFFWEERQMSI